MEKRRALLSEQGATQTYTDSSKVLVASSVGLSVITFAQLLIGLTARTIYAGIFGTSREMDVFLLVMGVVTWFTGIVVVAANKGLVPSFIKVREQRGEYNAWRMASTVINSLWLISLAAIALGWLLAYQVAALIGVGLEPQSRLLAAGLFRLAVPIIVTNLLTGIFSALLFSYNDFALPKALRLVGLVTTIATVVVLSPYIGIYSMAMGMLLDGLITCVVLTVRMRWKGLPYSPFCLDWNNKEVTHFVRVTFPLIGAALFSRAQDLVDRLFASFLMVGSISFLNYAYVLVHIPLTMLSSGIQVIFPHFSRLAALENIDEFRKNVERSLSFALFLAVPAFVGLLCLGRPAIVTLFQHGQFDAMSTESTSAALPFYFGLLLIGVPSAVLSYALYSLQQTRIILWIGTWDFLSNIAFDFMFMRWLGYKGIALATSAVLVVDACLLLVFVQRRIGLLDFRSISRSLLRAVLASAGMTAVVLPLHARLPILPTEHIEMASLVILAVQAAAGATTYGGLALALGSQEVRYLLRWSRGEARKTLGRLQVLYGSVFS